LEPFFQISKTATAEVPAISAKKSSFFRVQDFVSQQRHVCVGMSFANIEATQFGDKLSLAVSVIGNGSMMVYQHCNISISVHLSASRMVSVYSERCNPSTCKAPQSVCQDCTAMKEMLCSSSTQLSLGTDKGQVSGHFCEGMNPQNIMLTCHGPELKSVLKILRRRSQFQYSYRGDSFVVNSSSLGEITFHADTCNTMTSTCSTASQDACQALEQSLCRKSLPRPARKMEIFPQAGVITHRIRLIFQYWEDRERRSCFMSITFPHIAEQPQDSTTTLLPFDLVNSKLGNFYVLIQDYKIRLCSGVVGDSSPITERANREWLNDDLATVIPWAAQTVAGPNIFVLNSSLFYNRLFNGNEPRSMDKLSDSDLTSFFESNFSA